MPFEKDFNKNLHLVDKKQLQAEIGVTEDMIRQWTSNRETTIKKLEDAEGKQTLVDHGRTITDPELQKLKDQLKAYEKELAGFQENLKCRLEALAEKDKDV